MQKKMYFQKRQHSRLFKYVTLRLNNLNNFLDIFRDNLFYLLFKKIVLTLLGSKVKTKELNLFFIFVKCEFDVAFSLENLNIFSEQMKTFSFMYILFLFKELEYMQQIRKFSFNPKQAGGGEALKLFLSQHSCHREIL